MAHQPIEAMSAALLDSQAELSELLARLAERQDWQPGPEQWSPRFVAAHLATTERECFLDRVQRLAAGTQPHFDYYLNTGRDFSHLDLRQSLADWTDTRRTILDQVRRLAPEQLALTGTHAVFGTITVPDVLQTMLEHDHEHLAELRQAVAGSGAAGDSSR